MPESDRLGGLTGRYSDLDIDDAVDVFTREADGFTQAARHARIILSLILTVTALASGVVIFVANNPPPETTVYNIILSGPFFGAFLLTGAAAIGLSLTTLVSSYSRTINARNDANRVRWTGRTPRKPAGGRAVDQRMLSLVNSVGYILVIVAFVSLIGWVLDVYTTTSDATSAFGTLLGVFVAFAATALVLVHLGVIADYYRVVWGYISQHVRQYLETGDNERDAL